MLELKDRISLNIVIGGEALLFQQVNSLDFLHMSASTKIALPMIHIRYTDTVKFMLERKCLFDGARIDVSVSKDPNPAKTYTFLLNSYKEKQVGSNLVYDIDGYLAYPLYWNASATEKINGSASAALTEIAATAGFPDTDIAGTSDAQLWLPRNRRLHEWAKDIACRGYSNETACYQLAVDTSGRFRYVDVLKSRPSTTKFGVTMMEDGVVLVTSYKPKTGAGLRNKQGGYQSSRVEQKPLQPQNFRVHERIDLGNNDGSVMMSGAVKTQVKQGRVAVAPLDPGNVNENYERGTYQNKRAADMFNIGVDVLTPFVTDVSVLDKVDLLIPQEQEYLKQYSTSYVVGTRTILITGIDYWEKFELLSTTLNAEYIDKLKGETGELFQDQHFEE